MPPWEVLLPEFVREGRRQRRVLKALRSGAPVLHLTHARCLDGAACTLLHWLRYGRDQVADVPVEPHEVPEAIQVVADAAGSARMLHISDLSVGRADDAGAAARLRTLKEKDWRTVWRDHHAGQWTDETKSLVEAGVDRLVLDTEGEYCATDLVQKDLLPGHGFAEELARVVRDRDLWIRKDPRSDRLARAMMELGPEALMRLLFKSRDLDDPRIEAAAARWDERLDEERKEAKERTRVLEGRNGHRIGVLYGDYTTSDIAQAIREEHDTDVEALMKPSGGVSLRAKEDIDVSEVARDFGGGGHATAAGCTLGLSRPEYLLYWLTKGGGLKPRALVEALKGL